MRKFSTIAFLFILTSLFFSCSIGRKLENTHYLYLTPIDNTIKLENYYSSKYLKNKNFEKLKETFIEEFKNRLKDYNIVLLIERNDNHDLKVLNSFTIKIQELKYYEEFDIKEITGNRQAQEFNTYYVTSCNVSLDFCIGKEPFSFVGIKKHNVFVGKDEKLSTERTFWQIIFGTNKDNLVYTYKELDKDVFEDLTRKIARKTAAKVSQIIYKKSK
jgi:hypothetical protein